jgi:predicted dehydrogenase
LTTLRVGLVGAGRWGGNYVKTLSQLPGVRIAAVADPNEETRIRSEENWGIPARPSLGQILSEFDVDAVIVAAPDAAHFDLAAESLVADKDVLVEKPMAATPGEAQNLHDLATRRGRVIAVGHTAVYQSDFTAVRRRLRTAPPGSVYTASAARTSDGRRDTHASLIHDLCPHDLAMATLLMGEPESARARRNGLSVEYTIAFAGGSTLSGLAEWRHPPHVRRFSITDTRANLEIDGGKLWDDIRLSPLGRQCADFMESCRRRRAPLSNAGLGLTVTCCLAALDRSAADSGGWVAVKRDLPRVACG